MEPPGSLWSQVMSILRISDLEEWPSKVGFIFISCVQSFYGLKFAGMNSEIESLMAEHAAAMAEDDTNETEVSDAEMANRLSKTIAKKFATKRDNSGKPSINKYVCRFNIGIYLKFSISRPSHSTDTSALLANTSNFLAQVRAETDQNKKTKPNFLKPPSD